MNIMKPNNPEWVNKQHKTMLRWVNSKLGTNLTDLSTDLTDGLVLIKLINQIITEMDLEKTTLKLYLLNPLYKNPKFPIQKLENVNDFLEFIRIVLKINTTGISGDNIVEGNLKLILGLTWTLFIFSTTSSIGLYTEGNSIVQIKQIVLNWVNSRYKLSEISNFDRNWSLEVSSPDLVFYLILKLYIPCKDLKLVDSKLQNMKNILDFAKNLGIPKLADVEDFKALVPDEKCILFYILEWFKFFEVNGNESVDIVELEGSVDLEDPKVKETYDEVVERIGDLIRNKLEYETRSLRFSNRINTVTKKLGSLLSSMDQEFAKVLKKWYKDITNSNLGSEEFRDFTSGLHLRMTWVLENVRGLKDVQETMQSLSEELPLLTNLISSINMTLQSLNPRSKFNPVRTLSIDTLSEKFDKLTVLYRDDSQTITENYNNILSSALKTSNIPSLVIDDFEKVENFITQLGAELEQITEIQDPVFKTVDKVINVSERFERFKQKLLAFDASLITNEMEFTIILEELTSGKFNEKYIKNMIRYVPLKLVSLNFNDSDFSLVAESDDDDSEFDTSRGEIDSCKLGFEAKRRQVGSQLGNDRIYDIDEFFKKFEDGLKF